MVARFRSGMHALWFIVGIIAGVIGPVSAHAQPRRSIPETALTERQNAHHGGRIVVAGLFDWLFGGSQPGEPPRPAPGPQRRGPADDRGPSDEQEDFQQRSAPQSSGTYRTLCVRLCDGFPFPISFATTKDKLSTDARRCEQQCPAKSRLFAYRNPGQSLADMADLEGKLYKDLPAAFRYQSTYVADCTCHGNAWDAEAVARHEAYARAPQPEKDVKNADQSRTLAPQKRTRQSAWGYRDRRARENND